MSAPPSHSSSSAAGSGATNVSGGNKPLSDEEANKETKKMIAFIMQEAQEKFREIQIKADEEFHIEKAKLVRQETVSIEIQHEKRMKQAQVKRSIAISHQVNKARLEILGKREYAIQQMVIKVKERLYKSFLENHQNEDYEKLLEKLILQALFKGLESGTFTIQCRIRDVEIVNRATKKALEYYIEQTGFSNVNFQIDQNYSVPDDNAGGVIIYCNNGRIKCDNTLNTRLSYVSYKLMPVIRTSVFGPPINRKYFT